ESAAGLYCTTLVAVDVATTWTELQVIRGLHHQWVTGGIAAIHQRLPFPLRAWHSDNGSEFINHCLLGWCRRHAVHFTRGRPYRKNDQAWVEQRNGLLVRRLVGYDRYSSRAAQQALHRLYGLLRLQHNLFRPVPKLPRRQHPNHHARAQTPNHRLLTAGILTAEQRQTLDQQFQALDPIALAQNIPDPLDVLWKLADTRPAPRTAAHG